MGGRHPPASLPHSPLAAPLDPLPGTPRPTLPWPATRKCSAQPRHQLLQKPSSKPPGQAKDHALSWVPQAPSVAQLLEHKAPAGAPSAEPARPQTLSPPDLIWVSLEAAAGTVTPPLRGATSGPGTQTKPGSAASPEHCHRGSGELASCGDHAHSAPHSDSRDSLRGQSRPLPGQLRLPEEKAAASREGRGRPVAQAVRKGGRGPGRHKPRLLPLQGCGAATLSSTFPLLLPRGTRPHIHRGM